MKIFITLCYILFFWLALPAALFISSFFLDEIFRFSLTVNMRSAGVVIVLIALPLLIVSIVQYANASGNLPVSAYPAKKIIRDGLFRIWRHPIYLFFIMTLYGAGMVRGSVSMIIIVMPLFIVVVSVYIAIEEVFLVKRFGPDYRACREQTGLIIPRFHQFMKLPFKLLSIPLFTITVKGERNIPERAPFFVVSSHRNYLDPFIIGYTLPYRVRFITTHEMFRGKFLARLFSLFGCIPRKRYATDVRSVFMIKAALKKGSVIGVFPEGERSFTGEMSEFKAEVINFFRTFAHVPLLPVAISGNYLMWPRWGKGIRKCDVTVEFRESITILPEQSDREVITAIENAVRPDDADIRCVHNEKAKDIQIILYRCPACRKFDGIGSESNFFYCSFCGEEFSIDDGYRIKNKDGTFLTVNEFYQNIRVVPDDIIRAGMESGPAEFSSGLHRRLNKLFSGKLYLQDTRLIMVPENSTDNAKACEMELKNLRAATIEGSGKLQIYDGEFLYQAVFLRESARKWQDIIATAYYTLYKKYPILK